jgi:hypothetical protein
MFFRKESGTTNRFRSRLRCMTCPDFDSLPAWLKMMNQFTRRQFHRSLLAAGGSTAAFALLPQSAKADQATDLGKLRLTSFRFKVTPPVGHSLCGGWIKPVVATDDDLEAIGFVLQGCGDPIVICAVDWTGLLNTAHVRWRQSLAEAAGTTPDRVAVQCVHQHNAPFACLDAQAIVAAEGDLPEIVNVAFFEECLDQASEGGYRITEATSSSNSCRMASNQGAAGRFESTGFSQ